MDPEAWFFEGKSILDLEKQMKYYKEGFEMESSIHGHAWLGIGEIQKKRGNKIQAIVSITTAIEVDPKIYRAYRELYSIIDINKDLEEFIYIFEKMSENFPESIAARRYLGTIFNNTKKFNKAKEVFEDALKIAANDDKVWYGYGDALFGLADYNGALFAYQHINLHNPNLIEPWIKLAKTYHSLHNVSEECYCYEKASKLGDKEASNKANMMKEAGVNPKEITYYMR